MQWFSQKVLVAFWRWVTSIEGWPLLRDPWTWSIAMWTWWNSNKSPVGSASQVEQVVGSIVDIIDCLRRFHPRQLVTDGAGNGRFSQSATSQQGRPITPTTLFKGIPPDGRLANTKHKYVTLIRITNTKHKYKTYLKIFCEINEQNQLRWQDVNELKRQGLTF